MKTYEEMDSLHRQDRPWQINKQAEWLIEEAKLEYFFAKQDGETRAVFLLHDRHVAWRAVAEAAKRLVSEGFYVEYGLGLPICEYPGRPQERPQAISLMRREDFEADHEELVRSAHKKAGIASALAAAIGIVALFSGYQLLGDISLGCSSVLMFVGVALFISMKDRLERLRWRLDSQRQPVEIHYPKFILG